MQITSIYQPIEKDMLKVEEYLKDVKEVDLPCVAELLNHVLTKGGKRIRPALTLLAGKFYDYNLELLVPAAAAVELLHTATLVHDDVIDKSPERRGKPTINCLWGDSHAVLFGDYLFSTTSHLVSTTENIRVIDLFARTLMTISGAELEQASRAFNLSETREQYYQLIAGKTACLFSTATQSGAILSQAPEKMVEKLKDYGYNLGMAFQIVDDILDFIGQDREMGKPVGNDLSQGTLTLPAILFLEKHPVENPIEKIFHGKKDDVYLKLAIEMICNSPIIEECYSIANSFCSRACDAIEGLPQNPARSSLIELTDYIIQRKK